MSIAMFDRKAISSAFGAAASRYDEHAALQTQVRQQLLRLVANQWPKGAQIADIGGGTGALAGEKQAQGWQLTLVDMAYGMCQAAKRTLPHVVNAQAAQLPFADASMDGLFSSLMLQWVSEPEVVLHECFRIAKPQASMAISTFSSQTLHELRSAFAALDAAPHVSPFLSAAALQAAAQAAGWRVTHSEQKTDIHYYPDVRTLMHALKAIGASNKLTGRKRGLTTQTYMKRLQAAYVSAHATPQGLPASWDVLYLVLHKG
ncbi:MAG: methyltransferase domain-containing protein [Rickettsiales bacterium]|nr:methyltransferase domain-containing protein [Rickettsiales bacterium]